MCVCEERCTRVAMFGNGKSSVARADVINNKQHLVTYNLQMPNAKGYFRSLLCSNSSTSEPTLISTFCEVRLEMGVKRLPQRSFTFSPFKKKCGTFYRIISSTPFKGQK